MFLNIESVLITFKQSTMAVQWYYSHLNKSLKIALVSRYATRMFCKYKKFETLEAKLQPI